jgi:hypothetical protein
MKIILYNERPISWNKLYAGRHWSFRQEEAQRVHQLIMYSPERIEFTQNPFKEVYPSCDIIITAYFDKRPLDPDNICAKLYIDGLKGSIIKDDAKKYVRSVKTVSEIDRKNPRVEIDIINSGL